MEKTLETVGRLKPVAAYNAALSPRYAADAKSGRWKTRGIARSLFSASMFSNLLSEFFCNAVSLDLQPHNMRTRETRDCNASCLTQVSRRSPLSDYQDAATQLFPPQPFAAPEIGLTEITASTTTMYRSHLPATLSASNASMFAPLSTSSMLKHAKTRSKVGKLKAKAPVVRAVHALTHPRRDFGG